MIKFKNNKNQFYIFVIIISVSIIFQLYLIFISSNQINKDRENINYQLKIEKNRKKSNIIIALTEVRDELIKQNRDIKDVYIDPVKQINENYFVVSFVYEIPQEFVKNLVEDKFNEYEIFDKYSLGFYDCRNNTLIFDDYIINDSINTDFKWNHDGYYFGIYIKNNSVKNNLYANNLYDNQIIVSLILSTLILLLITILLIYYKILNKKQLKITSTTNDFINNMTHELKTPITTISTALSIIDRLEFNDVNSDKEKYKKFLSIIKNENNRLFNQVERVLQLSKLKKGTIDLEMDKLNINEIIDNCINTFSIILSQNNGEILFKERADNSIINGDIIHISNIFYNLMDNSNKYCKKTPKIVIKTLNLQNFIIIEFIDNGIGIDKEDLDFVFNQFYRVPKGDIHNVKGFGIGLFYTKKIIKIHKGKIEIESKIGQGTKFTIYFPLANNIEL